MVRKSRRGVNPTLSEVKYQTKEGKKERKKERKKRNCYEQSFIQGIKKEVSNILRDGSTHQNKKKKSYKNGSINAHFQSSVHLSMMADDATFGCESGSATDKVNIDETNTAMAQSYRTTAEGQRDALPWTDVTLSIS